MFHQTWGCSIGLGDVPSTLIAGISLIRWNWNHSICSTLNSGGSHFLRQERLGFCFPNPRLSLLAKHAVFQPRILWSIKPGNFFLAGHVLTDFPKLLPLKNATGCLLVQKIRNMLPMPVIFSRPPRHLCCRHFAKAEAPLKPMSLWQRSSISVCLVQHAVGGKRLKSSAWGEEPGCLYGGLQESLY